MLTTEPKTASTATKAKVNQLFFSKKEDSNFFGKNGQEPQPFFNPVSGYSVNGNGVLQTKLTIGQPNDEYEKEADKMADKVVQRMAEPSVQLKCAHCEEEEKNKLQKKSLIENISLPIRRTGEGAGTVSPQIVSSLESSKGNGSPLPWHTRSLMEAQFGTDFSQVRLHTGNTAIQMNKDLHAQAFTHGSDIYFNAGKYDTSSAGGRHLLVHELTHVVQQGAAGNVQLSPLPFVQAACEGKSVRNCRGSCTHPTSGYAGTCRWTGLTNGCKCFENPRSTRSLEDVLPYWITAILSAAAIALLAACFATGACEAGIIIGAAGAAVGAIIIGIFRAAGVEVVGEEA